MADKKFLQLTGFVKDYKDKIHPVDCGFGYVAEDGKIRITVRAIPQGNWDGSLVLQEKLANNASTSKEDPTIPF